MDVTPLIPQGQQIIQSYATGLFKVSGISYEGAIMVTPQDTQSWQGAPDNLNDVSLDHFQSLFLQAKDIDVLLLGTGEKMQFVPPSLRQSLSAKGLPIDVMDTGAACRTYNVLMAEGRRVVALLLPTA